MAAPAVKALADRVSVRIQEEPNWGDTPVTILTNSPLLQVVAASTKIVRATGSFVTDGYVVGMWVQTAGFTTAANNGVFKVTNIVTTTNPNDSLVLSLGTALVDEASTAGRTITTPAMNEMRVTAENLAHKKKTVVSNEIRADRQRADVVQVGVNTEGSLNFELSYGGAFDKLYEGALGAAAVISSSTITATVVADPTNTVTRSAGDFLADGYKVGQWVRFAGAFNGSNTGIWKITALTATVMTVNGPLATQGSTASCTVAGKMIRNGTTRKSYLIEEEYKDIAKFSYLNGQVVDQLSLSVKGQAIVTGSVSFTGKQEVTGSATVAGASVAVTTNAILNATANVGTLREGGAALSTAVMDIEISIKANNRIREQIGSLYPADIVQGTIDVTGKLGAYFEDLVLLNKFVNHTSSAFDFRFTDGSGNVVVVTIPKLYYTEAQPNASGINNDVPLDASFAAVQDPTTSCTIQIDIL